MFGRDLALDPVVASRAAVSLGNGRRNRVPGTRFLPEALIIRREIMCKAHDFSPYNGHRQAK